MVDCKCTALYCIANKSYLLYNYTHYFDSFNITYIGQQSVEYKLFTDYYNKLINTLPAGDLSHYFVSDKIISLTDHERIIRSMVPQDAAKLLLDRASLQIQNGNTSVFSKMLLIMDYHGINTAKTISLEIRKKLSAIKCEQGSSNHFISATYVCTNFS